MLPGYGDGFLSACLDAAGGRPESVIDQLLEGALPPEVAHLDPQMPLSHRAETLHPHVKGKGKAGMLCVLLALQAYLKVHTNLSTKSCPGCIVIMLCSFTALWHEGGGAGIRWGLPA